MPSSIARKGCREAELHGGCGMLAVEATEGAWLLSLLAVRCSARSAHAACQSRRSALNTLLPRANRPVEERPLHHTLACQRYAKFSKWALQSLLAVWRTLC
jgi:hypothetical protein